MLSVPGKGEGKEDCVTERIRKIFPSAPANPTVHRLDMDTSGLLIVARNAEAQAFLQRQFEQRTVRKLYEAYLAAHKPEAPLDGPIRLITKWLFPGSEEQHGTYKITKPDTDNMIKMFKDCMTRCGYWHDDAQVASEITEKFYGHYTGIYVKVEALS